MRKSNSPWQPLRHRSFLLVWLGSLAVYLAVWIQNVGAAWLMTTLAASPLLVALIQTATTLPAFLLGLPGGVLADIVDRKNLLLSCSGALIATALILVLLASLGMVTPVTLLLLTFLLGAGVAIQAPSWFSVQVESVPVPLIPAALALGSISFNIARAVGPAIAGLAIPVVGIETVFGLVACCFLAAIACIMAGAGGSAPVAAGQRENPFEALMGILRYSRYSPPLWHQLLRTFSFVVAASALWALLPLVAKYQLSQGAQVYGYLLGSLGIGAVAGAILTPVLLEYFSVNVLVFVAIVAFALVTASLSLINTVLPMCGVLLFAGMGWQLVGNFNLTSMQMSVPSWVRGRSLSVYMLVFQGAMALGGVFWGTVAEQWDFSIALFSASGALVLALLTAVLLPARISDSSETSAVRQREEQPCPAELAGMTGPLMVETEYIIRAADRDAFLALISTTSQARLRDGARSWQLVKGADNDLTYCYRLYTDSWRAYQRLLSRMTVKDEHDEQTLNAFHVEGRTPPKRFTIQD